jgi:hypothetical protein
MKYENTPPQNPSTMLAVATLFSTSNVHRLPNIKGAGFFFTLRP